MTVYLPSTKVPLGDQGANNNDNDENNNYNSDNYNSDNCYDNKNNNENTGGKKEQNDHSKSQF